MYTIVLATTKLFPYPPLLPPTLDSIRVMHRRDFLANVASTSLLAALPSIPLTAAERAALIDAKTSTLASDEWDMSWTDRLRGKSRAVFDSPQVSEGGALFRASLWREQHHAVLGTALGDLTPVIVIRHTAIPLIMDDAHWDRFDVGKEVKLKDPKTNKWAKRNPFAGTTPSSDDSSDITLPHLLSNGCIVLACNLAFGDVVDQYKKKDNLAQADAERAAKAHLLPGVIMQPSGFFAVLKAQDEGCRYMLGS